MNSSNVSDHILMFAANTADDNDAAAIYWSVTNVISLKMYDDSLNSWTESTISTATNNSIFNNIGAAIRHSDGNLLMAHHTAHDTVTDDIRTWDISVSSIATPTISSGAELATDVPESAQVDVFIDQNTDDVYIAYLKGGTWQTAVDVVYHKSSDAMASWSAENAYSEGTTGDFRLVSAGRTVSSNGGRYMPMFYNDDQADMVVNLVNDVDITGRADTLIDSSLVAGGQIGRNIWGPYWISSAIGAVTYISSDVAGARKVVVARTTDAGANWSSVVDVSTKAGSSVWLHSAWFDRENAGGTGTQLHLAWMDAAASSQQVAYRTYDISDASLGTFVSILTTATDSSLAVDFSPTGNRMSITKTVSSNILLAFHTQVADSLYCYKSSDGGASFSTIASPWETATEEDWLHLFPADTADDSDAVGIFWDRSEVAISLKMYDDVDDAWTESTFSGFNVSTPDLFYANLDASVRHSDLHILVAWHNNADIASDDLKTADITVSSTSPSISTLSNVFLNQDESAQVALTIDQNTDDVYVAYVKGGTWLTSALVVYHKSSDGMSNWSAENAYGESSGDFRAIHSGRTVSSDGGRFQPLMYEDDSPSVYVNLVNAVDIPSAVAAASSFRNELLSPILFDLPFGNLQPVPTSAIGQEEMISWAGKYSLITLSTAVVAAVNRYLTLLGVGQ
jgi:hypothetical protein